MAVSDSYKVYVLEQLQVVGPVVAKAMFGGVGLYREGLAHYRGRRFEEAITSFEAALKEKPDDGPSLMYIERCRHFIEEPPEPGWTGAWHATEK